jgi:hypothetical protein
MLNKTFITLGQDLLKGNTYCEMHLPIILLIFGAFDSTALLVARSANANGKSISQNRACMLASFLHVRST